MALKVGELFATLNLDDKDFSKALKSASGQMDTLKSAISSSEKNIERYGSALETAKKNLQDAMKAQSENAEKLKAARETQEALKSKVKELNNAYKTQVKATGENSNAANELGLKLLEAKDALSQANQEVRTLSGESKAGEANIAKLSKSVDDIGDNLESAKAGLSQFKQELSAANALLNSNAAALEAAGTKLKGYSDQIKNVAERQEKLGSALTMGVSMPIAAAIGYAAKEAISFEDAFAGVEKTVDASASELAEMRQAFVDLSEEIPVSKEELASIGESAGQLGIAKEVIVDFSKTMADLSATTNLGADAAEDLAKFANITQMEQTGENFERLGSTIVDLGNNLATTESDVTAMAMRLAGAGAQAGMSEADILGVSGALSSLGIEAEAGGSAFSRLISEMQLAVETGSDDLAGFANVAGMTGDEFKRAFRDDAAGALSAFIVGLGSGTQSATQIMDELGITELRLTDALRRSSNASELFASSIARANSAWDENNALTNEASKRYKTTASRLKMLKNQVSNTAASFGDVMLPTIENMVGTMSGFIDQFSALDEGTRTSIVNMGLFAASVGPAIKILGKANGAISAVTGGLGNLMTSAASAGGGFLGLGSAILKGVSAALGPAGIAIAAAAGIAITWKLLNQESYEPDLQSKLEKALENVEISDEIMAKVTADFELSEETQANIATFTDSATSVYDEIGKALTDGKPDTEQVVNGLQENVTGLFSEVRANIETWYNDEMAKLDLNTAEGIAQAEELTRIRDEYIQQTSETEQATGEFVNTWAGASTSLVNQHISELDALLSKVTELNAEIATRSELARSAQRYSFDVVSMGQTTKTETISEALNYAFMNWSLDADAIEQYSTEQFAAARKAFSEGGESWKEFLKSSDLAEQLGLDADYSDWEALFSANQDAQIASASEAYQNNLRKIFDGIFKSYGDSGEAFQLDLSRYFTGEQAITGIESIFDMLDTSSLATMTPEQKSLLQSSIDQLLQEYASIVGEEFSGSDTIQKALENNDTMTLESVMNGLQAEIESMMVEFTGGLDETLTSELPGVAEAFKMLLESGMMEGVSGVDMESWDSQLAGIFSTVGTGSAKAVGDDIGAGIGEGIAGHSYSGDAAQAVDQIEADLRRSAQSHSPAQAFVPVGSDISAGVGEGMLQFSFSPIAQEIATNIKSTLSAATASVRASGLNLSRGLAQGILAGKSVVISAAKQVMRAAIKAANSEAEIQSPSRVMMRSGAFFGEGFANGILNSATSVSKAASAMAQTAIRAARISNPGAQAQAVYAGGSAGSAQAIDYDRLADAMSQRPMVLTQNGRVVATVQARDNAMARNGMERRYALGYGK